MRSLLLFIIFFTTIPAALIRPYIGIYIWTWLGFMNPHRLTFGAAYDFPFSQVTAIITIVGVLFSTDRSKVPVNALTIFWLLFVLWMSISTFFAVDGESAFVGWDRMIKIQLFSFLTIVLINTRKKLNVLLWIGACAIGFYGIKGGVYVIVTGAEHRVWGPPGSFIQDNNAIGLALILTIPLLWFLLETIKRRSGKMMIGTAVFLTSLAIMGTHSRGALLGLSAVVILLLKRQKKNWLIFVAFVVAIPTVIQFMPEHWMDRMGTIRSYQVDSSAMGRIRAWNFAWEMGKSRLTGGGFNSFAEQNYRMYAPDIAEEIDNSDGKFQDAHSIYFGVLGEHGIPGLVLFLIIGVLVLQKSRRIEKIAEADGDEWSAKLSSLLRISLIGYAISGTFLGLAYFDYYYYLIAVVIILERHVVNRIDQIDSNLAAASDNEISNDALHDLQANERAN